MTNTLHTNEYSEFVALLIEARKNSGKTQQQVADQLGKPQSYVAKVENNERRMDIVEFITYANALESNPAKLFDGLLKRIG